jgi:hypothetical protein
MEDSWKGRLLASAATGEISCPKTRRFAVSDRKPSKPGDVIRDVNSGIFASETAKPISR